MIKMVKVVFKRISEIEKSVKECLDLLNPKPTKEVLIKPNLTHGGLPNSGVATNVFVLKALIDWLNERGINAIVAEGSGGQDTETAFKQSGYEILSTPLIDLNKDEFVKVKVKNPLEWKEIEVSKTFYNAKYVINVPVAKCHSLAGVTLGIKNIMGVLKPNWREGHWAKHLIHKEATLGIGDQKRAKILFERRLIDLFSIKKIDFTLIDGSWGMEEQEVYGSPIKTDFLIASEDTIAADIFCSHVIGFNPKDIYYLELAQQIWGKRRIEIIGDKPVYFKFKKSKDWLELKT